MPRSAAELHQAAVQQANRGRTEKAEHLLAEAAALADTPDVKARIQGTSSYLLARRGETEEADRIARRAFETPGITAETRGILAGQLGAIAEHLGRFDDARVWLDRALDEVANEEARGSILLNRSLLNIRLRNLASAADDATAAAEIFGRVGESVMQAQARHNAGYIELLRGDLVLALQMMLTAKETLDTASAISKAIGDIDRAEVLRDAGQTREAERLLARSAPVFGRHRMPQSRAETEFQLARSQLMHDPAKARVTAAASAKRFRSVGNETWATRADAVRLRAILTAGAPTTTGPRPEPRKAVDPAEAEATADALDAFGFTSDAAALRLSLDIWRSRHPRAPRGDGARVRVPSTASLEVHLLAHEARAERAAAAGRESLVRKHASAGLDELAEWQGTFGSLDLQTSITAHGTGLIVAGLASAVRSRRADVMFEWSERARHLSQQVVPMRPPQDPQLAADLAELRHLRADDPTGAWRRDPRVLGLEERARERQWSATAAAGIHEHITLEGLRHALDDRTALLAYIYSGAVLTALVITRDRARIIDLPRWQFARKALPGLRADLDMAASVTGPMASVVRRALDHRLEEVSASLLDEAVAYADVDRFVITAPGILGGLPWGMLPALRGRPFTLPASATLWATQQGAGGMPATAGFAVGPGVARGDEEVGSAASAWDSAWLLRGGDATVDAVAELAADVDVLHVAAHGRHAADNALFSGFELADGTLFGYDVDRIPRVPSIVVLSSCEVGRSSVRWGEEAVGMTRVWLHAGTRAVVATPVIVADDIACDLLGAMHEGLVAGLGPSVALADASAKTGLVSSFQVHGAGF